MPPPRITPLRLGRRAEPFNDPAWLCELKWDGFRSLAVIEDDRCELWSRKGNRFKRWADLVGAVGQLGVKSAILDGEVVCVDDQGRADFKSLLFRRAIPCSMPLICSGSMDMMLR